MSNSTIRYTLDANRYSLALGWLYPDLMSIYGDRGNIICLTKRCEWRGVSVTVKRIGIDSPIKDLTASDLLFGGGAQDSQQTIVFEDLKKNKGEHLRDLIEKGIPGLYICGAYQFLGQYYKEADGNIIKGLGILDLYTENPGPDKKRLIGNVVAEANGILHIAYSDSNNAASIRYTQYAIRNSLVGFENHGGRTYLGKNIKPLAKIIKGYGNNGEDGYEGAVYKNSFGSYLHGPILPKNPHFADYLISLALEKKYGKKIELPKLDDTLAWKAHGSILKGL